MSKPNGILGRKIGMTQIFDEKGSRIGVTVVEAGPCNVLQVKTEETDGYNALQLGFADKREKNTTKPLVGHFMKAKTAPKRYVREIRLDGPAEMKVGEAVTVDVLEGVQKVDVIGLSKGKGFAGTMKRWNFGGSRASHGCSKRHRSPGSLGRQMSVNKGVPKGKRMSGHLGQERITVQGLHLVKIDGDHNLLLIKGAVPGANGDYLIVRKSIQDKVAEDKKKKAG